MSTPEKPEKTPEKTPDTQPATTTTLSQTQEALVQATLARMGPPAITTPTPAPTITTPSPTQTTTTATVDIRSLVASGGLTLDVLENFLTSQCTWCYAGGYAAILHARHAGTPESTTTDLDILIDASQISAVRRAMYGDNPSGTTNAEGYTVTLLSASPGQVGNRIQIGTAYVVPLTHLQLNYGRGGRSGLGDLIKSRPALKTTDTSEDIRQDVRDRDNTVSQTVDPAKAERRRARAEVLEKVASAQQKEKVTEKKEKEKPDKPKDDDGGDDDSTVT